MQDIERYLGVNLEQEWLFFLICARDDGAAIVRLGWEEEKSRSGVIAQLVERVLSMHEALGSTPSNSIFLYFTIRHIIDLWTQPTKTCAAFKLYSKSVRPAPFRQE